MSQEMNLNGCTTCNTPGTEKYEPYTIKIGRKTLSMYQYDYRFDNGDLFSCCAPTLEECRRRRDEWLKFNN